MNFDEKTFGVFRINIGQLILQDPIIRGLFDLMVLSSTEDLPDYAGNFLMYYETKTDDIELLRDFYNSMEFKTIKEITEIYRAELINELKDLIPAEIEYIY